MGIEVKAILVIGVSARLGRAFAETALGRVIADICRRSTKGLAIDLVGLNAPANLRVKIWRDKVGDEIWRGAQSSKSPLRRVRSGHVALLSKINLVGDEKVSKIRDVIQHAFAIACVKGKNFKIRGELEIGRKETVIEPAQLDPFPLRVEEDEVRPLIQPLARVPYKYDVLKRPT